MFLALLRRRSHVVVILRDVIVARSLVSVLRQRGAVVFAHLRALDVFAAVVVVVVWRVVHSVSERLFFGRVRERLHATLTIRILVTGRAVVRVALKLVLVSFRPRVGAAALFRLGLRRRIADDVESLSPILQRVTERPVRVRILLTLRWWRSRVVVAGTASRRGRDGAFATARAAARPFAVGAGARGVR